MPKILEQIYREHKQALFTLALSITGCESSAEDCIQQVFLKLGKRSPFGDRDLAAYVFRSVRNAAIDSLRSAKRRDQLRESVFNGYVPPRAHLMVNPDESTLTAERDQILRSAIDQLEEIPRQVVLLKSFSNLTYRQISIAIDIPEKTAATHYRRALLSLAEKLKGQI